MKKLLALSLLFVLTTAAVFGQFSVGNSAGDATISLSEWGRVAFLPAQIFIQDGVDTKAYSGIGASWGGDGYEIGIAITGKADKFGFTAQFFAGDGVNLAGAANPGYTYAYDRFTWGLGDNVFLEVFPIDWLRLRYGKFHFDDLRGKVDTDTDFAGYVGNLATKDAIFARIATRSAASLPNDVENGWIHGALITAAPIEGLLIGAKFQGPDGNGGSSLEAEEFYQMIVVAAGYNIANIGHIRAQYIGDYDNTEKALKDKDGKYYNGATNYFDTFVKGSPFGRRIEAAFALTMIQNLTIDLGAKFYIPMSGELPALDTETAHYGQVKYSFQKPHSIALGVNFAPGALGVAGTIVANFAGHNEFESAKTQVKETYDTVFGLDFHAVPSFNLGFGTVGGDLGFGIDPEAKTKIGNNETITDPQYNFGIGAWFQLPVSAASLKAGLAVKLANMSEANNAKMGTTISIPIIMEVSF